MDYQFKVGDIVEFETRSNGYPRWNDSHDFIGTGCFKLGKVTFVNAIKVVVQSYNNASLYVWTWKKKFFKKNLPGYLKLSQKWSRDFHKKVFYIEVETAFKDNSGKYFPKGFVSQACEDPISYDYMSILLLDESKREDLNEAVQSDHLEVKRISKSSYYKRRGNNSAIVHKALLALKN